MQDNKWRKLKAETDQVFFFILFWVFLHTGKTRHQNTPDFDPLCWCVSYPFYIWAAKLFSKSYVSQKAPVFFVFVFKISLTPHSLGLHSCPSLFIWIPWKLSFLLFPVCLSLSLAASADLVIDITTVDISVLLLFSLSVLGVCSTFFSQWWNLFYDQLRQGNEKFLALSTVQNNIWKSYLNGEKKIWIVFFTGIKLVLRMLLDFWRYSSKQCFWFGHEIKVKDVKNRCVI